MTNCTKIIFANRACNAIISETIDKIPTETGGILLGRIIDTVWYVIESIDPGPDSIFTISYFEYDTLYVNHLAKVLSKQYKIELEVLGLWHRHPGSMDTFSSTDNGTNSTFARMNSKGAISGLINIDPTLRLTMYHVSFPLQYEKIPYKVGDHLLPESLLTYKHTEEKNRINLNQHCLPYVCPPPVAVVNKMESLPKNIHGFFSRLKQYYLENSLVNINTGVLTTYLKAITFYKKEEEINEQSLERVLKEEITLDENGYQYECKTKGGKLIYCIKGNKENKRFNSKITFRVSVNTSNPALEFKQKKIDLREGIFLNYIESCLTNTQLVN